METELNFDIFKSILNKKIKKDVSDILKLTDNYLELYKKFRRESDTKKKREYRQKAYEYMRIIHNLFSDIENSLREYKEKALDYGSKLKDEDIPDFEDYIEMNEEEYKKFKNENDFDEQRMFVWLQLFKKKIKYLTNIITKDIENNIKVDKKIKLINQFYRQIFVAYKIILNDAFMLGVSEKKIKIKKG